MRRPGKLVWPQGHRGFESLSLRLRFAVARKSEGEQGNMKSDKFIVIGGLTGFIIGLVVVFVFPDLLLFAVLYTSTMRTHLGLPVNYAPYPGSPLDVIMIFPILIAMFCGFLASVLYKVRHNK